MLVLLAVIGVVGLYFSVSSFSAIESDVEVEATPGQSLVEEGDSVVVTVREANSGDPVTGATVVPDAADRPIDAAPDRTTNESGQAVFAVGDGSDAVTVGWRTGDDSTDVHFDVQTDGETYVDRVDNSAVTVLRS